MAEVTWTLPCRCVLRYDSSLADNPTLAVDNAVRESSCSDHGSAGTELSRKRRAAQDAFLHNTIKLSAMEDAEVGMQADVPIFDEHESVVGYEPRRGVRPNFQFRVRWLGTGSLRRIEVRVVGATPAQLLRMRQYVVDRLTAAQADRIDVVTS